MKRLMMTIAIGVALVTDSAAQPYPNRSIRFVVPFAPGGGTDIVARRLAQKLTESLGQSVVADNRSGAGGILGTDIAAKSAADGYTIVMGTTSTLVLNPSLYRNLPYDPFRDFAPISLIATAPHVLALHPSVPVKSVRELIAFAKARPGQLSFSSGGNVGSSHMSGAMFNMMAGSKMVHIPYRGTGPAALAVVSGEVSLGFNDVLTTLPHVKTGRLRGLAVTGVKRSPSAPDLPTIAEAALPRFESGVWYGVLAPAKTPSEIIARLNAEVVKILNRPDMREALLAEGGEVVGNSPEQFSEYIKVQYGRWAKVIKNANIHAE